MAIRTERYEKAAARLAELPRAERFEELIDFPARHMFKAIGQSRGFASAIRSTLASLGHSGIVLVERPSAKGTYTSISFELEVNSGERLDTIYSALERVAGLAYLL